MRTQLLIVVSFFIVVTALSFYAYTYNLQRDIYTRGFIQTIDNLLETVRVGVELGLSEENYIVINNVLTIAKKKPIVRFLVVTDSSNTGIMAQYPEEEVFYLPGLDTLSHLPSLQQPIIVRKTAIKAKMGLTDFTGILYIGFSTAEYHQLVSMTTRDITLFSVLGLLVGLCITYLISMGISRPLIRFRAITQKIFAGETNVRADEQTGNKDMNTLAVAFNLMLGKLLDSQQQIENQNRLLAIERTKNEELLANVLPATIAERLKKGETLIADSFPAVTVIFADIVGFTELSMRSSPTQLIDLLNRIFSLLDNFCAMYNVEKVKTIGDAYMIVSGAPVERSDHIFAAAEMALEIIDAVHLLSQTLNVPLNVRVGMHTGPVVAGIIGTTKIAYDLWGDTVNLASRMESHGIPGKIHCTDEIYQLLKHDFLFEFRGEVSIKSKGVMNTWFLVGRKKYTEK